MSKVSGRIIDRFYGGITRDDRSYMDGAAREVENLDIYANKDEVRITEAFSSLTVPAGTRVSAYAVDNDGNVWGYGSNTTDGKIRIVKQNTFFSSMTTVFDSSNTDTWMTTSPVVYHRTAEDSDPNSLYYLVERSGAVYLVRYNIDAEEEQWWNGTAWTTTGSPGDDAKLDNITYGISTDRVFIRSEFGELLIGNGNKIAKVDAEGTFVKDAFTLPTGWVAVDMTFVSDISLILARHVNTNQNWCRAYWWDLTSSVQFDDSIMIPYGGPQWIINFKEKLFVLCSQNGKAKFFSAQPYQGAPLVEIPGIEIDDVKDEGNSNPVCSPHNVQVSNGILYFPIRNGEVNDDIYIYSLGQLDDDKPIAITKAKTVVAGIENNFYHGGFLINGTTWVFSYYTYDTGLYPYTHLKSTSTRHSTGTYESLIFDDGDPTRDKHLKSIFVNTQPLPAGTSIDVYVSTDYGEYVQLYREDGSSFNTEGRVYADFSVKSKMCKTFQIKLVAHASGASTPVICSIGYKLNVDNRPAHG